MNTNKFKITTAIGILLVLIFGSSLVWTIFFKSTEPKPENTSFQSSDTSVRTPNFGLLKEHDVSFSFQEPNDNKDKLNSNIISLVGEVLQVPKLPIPKPDISTPSNGISTTPLLEPFSSFFTDIYNATKIAEEKIKTIITEEREVSTPSQDTIETLSLPDTITTENGIIVLMTDYEFHYLYPDNFIKNLMESQTLLKQYNPSYEALPKIGTDEDVRFVEEKIISALYSAGMLTKEETERYITTIRFTLPELQLKELEILNVSNLNKIESNKNQKSGLFLAGLLEKFRSVFIKESEAKACGACMILPICFRQGPASPAPGINIFRAFCVCTGCLYGQGCLDFCNPMAAIWDPMTGICGCG